MGKTNWTQIALIGAGAYLLLSYTKEGEGQGLAGLGGLAAPIINVLPAALTGGGEGGGFGLGDITNIFNNPAGILPDGFLPENVPSVEELTQAVKDALLGEGGLNIPTAEDLAQAAKDSLLDLLPDGLLPDGLLNIPDGLLPDGDDDGKTKKDTPTLKGWADDIGGQWVNFVTGWQEQEPIRSVLDAVSGFFYPKAQKSGRTRQIEDTDKPYVDYFARMKESLFEPHYIYADTKKQAEALLAPTTPVSRPPYLANRSNSNRNGNSGRRYTAHKDGQHVSMSLNEAMEYGGGT